MEAEAGQILHDVVECSVASGTVVVDFDRVGVGQAGGSTDFAFEASEGARVCCARRRE